MNNIILNWTDKYAPNTLSNVIGHNKIIEEIKEWAYSWTEGIPKNRAVILYGKAGIGKTTIAHALAKDMGWEIIEMNASDQRTSGEINKVVGYASRSNSVSLDINKIKRVIIMDEADNIHGKSDRGGEATIVKLIKKTEYPIILIANELYEMSSSLRNSCKPIQFNPLTTNLIISTLKKIGESEGVRYESGAIEKIAENSNGDLRSAINDLQAISQGKEFIKITDVITSERDSNENIFKFLEKVFKGEDIKSIYESSFNLDKNPDDIIKWMDENLLVEYTKIGDIINGYKYLGKASTFLGRVKRRQNYGLWKYANILMTSGTVSKSSQHNKYARYELPSLWRKLGQTKEIKIVRNSIAKKIGICCHCSTNFAIVQLFPFFKIMMKDDDYAVKIASFLGLELEEIAFLLELNDEDDKVQKIYDNAQLIGKINEVKIIDDKKEEYIILAEKENNGQHTLFDF